MRVFHNAVSERIPPPKGGYNAYVSRLGGQIPAGIEPTPVVRARQSPNRAGSGFVGSLPVGEQGTYEPALQR